MHRSIFFEYFDFENFYFSFPPHSPKNFKIQLFTSNSFRKNAGRFLFYIRILSGKSFSRFLFWPLFWPKRLYQREGPFGTKFYSRFNLWFNFDISLIASKACFFLLFLGTKLPKSVTKEIKLRRNFFYEIILCFWELDFVMIFQNFYLNKVTNNTLKEVLAQIYFLIWAQFPPNLANYTNIQRRGLI